MSTVRTYLRAIGYVDDRLAQSAVFSTGFAVLEPLPQFDRRYFYYACRSEPFVEEVVARSVGVSYPAIAPSDLGSIGIPSPPTAEQRRIADFLDDQVARIDEIIRLRELQSGAIWERRTSVIGELVAGLMARGGSRPLAAVAHVIDTAHQTAPGTDGGGYWIVGTPAIRDGALVPDRFFEINRADYAVWTQRGRPEPGDVVLSREAPVGEVALLGPEDERLAIGQRVVLLKPSSDVAGRGLLLLLQSPQSARFVEDVTQGSLHPHLNISDVRHIPIPWATEAEWSFAIQQYGEVDRVASLARHEMRRQAALLQERKRSLITAAVTGEFDVTAASGRGVA